MVGTIWFIWVGWWWGPGLVWFSIGLSLARVVGLVGCIGSFEGEGWWFWLSFNIGGFSLMISFFDSSLVGAVGWFEVAGFILGIGCGMFQF